MQHRANPEQLRQQRQRRESVQQYILAKLSEHPRQLRLWQLCRPMDPNHHRPEPDSIVVVLNLDDRFQPTSLRTLLSKPIRHGDLQWLNPAAFTCPESGIIPDEATMFCITGEPTLKAIILTPAGWNDCWVLRQNVDDEEDNPLLSALTPVKKAEEMLASLPNKAIFTPPHNLLGNPLSEV